MATHSSILAWKTPWTEEPGGLHPGCKELDTAEHTCTQVIKLGWQVVQHKFPFSLSLTESRHLTHSQLLR